MNIKSLVSLIFVFLLAIPGSAFAHGTEAEHQQEIVTNTFLSYGLIALGVITVIGIIMIIVTKKQLNNVNPEMKDVQIQRNKIRKRLKLNQWISVIAILALVVTGIFSFSNKNTSGSSVEFMHIHGLGYTSNGKQIYIPSHDGLKIYQDDKWKKVSGEEIDYMGFVMVDDGFYSSGHPGEGSSLINPLGIVKTTDMGKTLDKLDLFGEMDFHIMTVGYDTHVIYVFNPQANSRMAEIGLYYSLDDTKTWEKAAMNGVDGEITALAAHPTNKKIIALSTNQGVFLSKDYGNTFEKISDKPASTISFSEQGKLFAGGVTSELLMIDIDKKDFSTIKVPSLSNDDAIGYIAINPKNEKQVVITTFEKNIYISQNLGGKWTTLANEGKGIDLEK